MRGDMTRRQAEKLHLRRLGFVLTSLMVGWGTWHSQSLTGGPVIAFMLGSLLLVTGITYVAVRTAPTANKAALESMNFWHAWWHMVCAWRTWGWYLALFTVAFVGPLVVTRGWGTLLGALALGTGISVLQDVRRLRRAFPNAGPNTILPRNHRDVPHR